jgi:hypothetical protein
MEGVYTTLDEEYVFDWDRVKLAVRKIPADHLMTITNAEDIMPEPSSNTDLTFSDTEVRVKCWSDGTTTRVQLVGEIENGGFFGTRKEKILLGEGTARRRKGDRRRNEVGFGLALARALASAAKLQAADAEKLLEE